MASYIEKVLYCDSAAYGPSGVDGGVARWTASTAYTVGQIIRQRTAPTVPNERCYICILAGTSLATEPTWSSLTSKGVIITEAAGPKWQECTAQASLNGDLANTISWAANMLSVHLGLIIKNTAATHYFICTVAGSQFTVAAEPTWNTTPGATTVEGGITWTCLGAVGSFSTRWAAPAARLAHLYSNSTEWTSNDNMIIFVGDDHAETIASGTMQLIPSSLTEGSVVCIDHTAALPPTPADLRTTATFTTTGTGALVIFNQSATYAYGLKFINTGTGAFDIGSGTNNQSRFDTCTFSLTNTNTGLKIRIGLTSSLNGAQFEFKDCTFNMAASGQMIQLDMANIKLENCAFTGVLAGASQALFTGGSRLSNVVIEGSDFSTLAAGGALVARGVSGSIMFKDCKLPANLTSVFVSGDTNMFTGLVIDLVRCASDGTNYRNERHTSGGAETISTKLVRTGGAVDGNTPISHQLAINATVVSPYTVFNAWPLVIWNDIINADRFVTMYGIANDIRVPTYDELFMNVEYLGSAASPLGSFKRGGKPTILSAAGALASDTSAWDTQLPAVTRSTAYVVGDVVKSTDNPGRAFFCTGAGTTGASLPVDGLVKLNTLDSESNVQLAADGLTITSMGVNGAIRTTGAQTSGRFYFEAKNLATEMYLGYSTGVVGIITGSSSFANYSTNGCTIDFQGTVWSCGTRYLNVLPGYPTLAPGVSWCIAVDLVNKRFWVRYDNSDWNGNAANNPVTNVGGIDISALFPTNAVYGFADISGTQPNTNCGLQFKLNYGQSAFDYPVPSGFFGGPFAQGWGSAIDGTVVGDGTATFRAGCRFSQTLGLTAPQPQQKGYVYAYPRVGRSAVPYFLDPKLRLS